METHHIILLSLALLGLILGSFINVVIARYPKMLTQTWRKECLEFLNLPTETRVHFNLALPRSHCPHCQHQLAWHDLFPVLSFAWLKGKCRYCHTKISWQYPLVEIVNSIILVVIAERFGLTFHAATLMLASEILLVLALIDFNTQLLPDEFSLSLLWLGLIVSATTDSIAPYAAILGAALGYALPWCINFLYRLFRKREGMGYGDFKCFAAFGAWLGIQALPCLFLLAISLGLVFSVAGLILKKLQFKQTFPFGPAIIAAGWAMLLWSQPIDYYFNRLLY